MVGIIVVWKRKKSEQHTKPEGVYYSTINETMLQRSPSNKPEAVYSEINDGQDSKEPEYMDISKSGQSTEQAGKIIMQDNQLILQNTKLKCKIILLTLLLTCDNEITTKAL